MWRYTKFGMASAAIMDMPGNHPGDCRACFPCLKKTYAQKPGLSLLAFALRCISSSSGCLLSPVFRELFYLLNCSFSGLLCCLLSKLFYFLRCRLDRLLYCLLSKLFDLLD